MKKAISAAWLQRSTLHYVQRYPASVQRVRQVMVRRVDRKLREHDGDRAALLEQLDALLESLQHRGHLSDLRQAGLWLDVWHRKGLSARGLRAKLAQKGISSQLIDHAMKEFFEQWQEQDAVDPECQAAENYARRRRLGPYRRDLSQRAERRQKDLSALARQGFSFDIAKKVIDRDPDV